MKKKETCEGCPALCCKGLEKDIPSPKTKLDRENLVWQAHFVNTKFFIRDRKWRELSLGDCRYLDSANLCTVYEKRPDVCRNHNPPECERFGEIFDVMFDTPEDLLAHFQKARDKKGGKKKSKSAGKKRRGP
jgi:hypothetical protein